jgi:hypothetical protein
MPYRAILGQAAIVDALRVQTAAHTRWPLCWLWQTMVSLDNTISTRGRVFQVG